MKTYTIYSGYTNTVVGKIHDDCKGNMTCELLCPEGRFDFPIDLFGPHRDWERDHVPTIMRWLESRVVPRNRQFLREMLDAEGIPEWDLDTLLKLNHGKTVNDKFSVEITED